MADLPNKWTGLQPSRFLKYRSWINKQKPGICGTYCAAVLLHDAIYQKTNHSLSKEKLLNGLKPVVDGALPYRGTFFWDIANGLRRLLNQSKIWRIRTGLLAETIVVKQLSSDHPQPVIVGTTKYLNSKYKNHWLVVYAYGYNESGKLFFRAYDNHGRYKAVVPASQTLACVWLEER